MALPVRVAFFQVKFVCAVGVYVSVYVHVHVCMCVCMYVMWYICVKWHLSHLQILVITHFLCMWTVCRTLVIVVLHA